MKRLLLLGTLMLSACGTEVQKTVGEQEGSYRAGTTENLTYEIKGKVVTVQGKPEFTGNNCFVSTTYSILTNKPDTVVTNNHSVGKVRVSDFTNFPDLIPVSVVEIGPVKYREFCNKSGGKL